METQNLIYLISCAVNGVKPDPERVAGMDLDAIFSLASRHMLAATVAPALKAAGIQDKRFAKALEHSALKSSTMDMEMDALFVELDAAGIWHMPLKGIVLQHLYPIYGMRQMSDHDILFDADRAEDVKSIMEGLGFSTEHFGTSNHDVYHKEPVSNFEMHSALFGATSTKVFMAYFKNTKSRLIRDGADGYGYHFTPEDFYIYILAHEYKHFENGGTGLRSLLDIYVYLTRTTLNMNYVRDEVKKLGISSFEYMNRRLALDLFGGRELDEKEQKLLNYIMSSGTYGTMKNRVSYQIKKKGRWGYFWSRVFQPYGLMIGPYPILKKLPVLLPFFWVVRLISAVINKRDRVRYQLGAVLRRKKHSR